MACACGSGKQLKFCCADALRKLRMQEAVQRAKRIQLEVRQEKEAWAACGPRNGGASDAKPAPLESAGRPDADLPMGAPRPASAGVQPAPATHAI